MNSFSAKSQPHLATGGTALRPHAPATKGPCLQIQIDLSAMLDGELDQASVRRVLVHSDMCPSCRAFLDGIRSQLRAHRELAEFGMLDAFGNEVVEFGEGSELGDGFGARGRGAEFREQLIQNRHQLAQILYELGRAHVLIGLSPSFSREVAQEPVPIPDMSARGRNLLDEVERLAAGSVGVEWVRAKALFGAEVLTDQAENMKKGKRLLNEALMLRPDFHQARIYLGHIYHVNEEYGLARREFRCVLGESTDLLVRAFALENLGNVYLEEGRTAESIQFFLELVESGVIQGEPRFFTTYFNLALAYGILRRFQDCRIWLRRLHDEFPHKRRLVGEQLRARTALVRTMRDHPDVERDLIAEFREWFPLTTKKEAC